MIFARQDYWKVSKQLKEFQNQPECFISIANLNIYQLPVETLGISSGFLLVARPKFSKCGLRLAH